LSPSQILSLRGVSKFFGGVQAVLDVYLDVLEGEMLGLIGPNGAGKSTLAKLILGSLKPSTGKVFFGGRDITGLSRRERAGLGIAGTNQFPRVFSSLTLRENLEISLKSGGGKHLFESVAEVAELLGLSGLLEAQASSLSHGQRRLLEIGMALVSGSRLLVLDEPSQGLTGGEVERLASILTGLSSKRLSVILIDHRVDFVKSLSGRVGVMSKGRMVALGPAGDKGVADVIEEVYLRGLDAGD